MLDCLSRALSGSSSDKQFNVVIGDGNSGKGVISDLLSNSLGIFTATTNASNFSVDKFGGGDKAKKKSWIAAIKDCRIAICNEVEMGHALDGNIIKSICSFNRSHHWATLLGYVVPINICGGCGYIQSFKIYAYTF